MARNQYCRIMSLFIGMFLMVAMMSKCDAAAFPLDDSESSEENEHWSLQRLRQLARPSEWDDDGELTLETRSDPVDQCTADILQGYKYSSTQSYTYYRQIDSTQICMDKCDVDGTCVGWSYDSSAKVCNLYPAINQIIRDVNFKSGSCIGTSIKAKCTEQRSGQYTGWFGNPIENIGSVSACMARCDQSVTCLGWLYAPYGKKCYIGGIDKFIASSSFTSGSCLAPQKRISVADSIDLFRQQALKRHNLKRKQHCSPALTLDENLNTISQNLANKLAAADVIPPSYQETNLQTVYYTKANHDMNGGISVDCFYDESKYYNWNNPDITFASNFAKVLWKSSRKMGVGRAFGNNKLSMYVVTTYDWHGNLGASYQNNIPRKCA